ncbi:hypothetical protein [Pseudidiomarina sediminum]|uniref:hypothetical protein n=1 Tax=Pseudidiomarina sediminum TaxID=431675 RepID=UPI001C97CE81|nr:hypothetical protein [Pseudidiomarina sediminum]MBY6063678.1 hypothetical protein [Pseudidiomarina sediminum]
MTPIEQVQALSRAFHDLQSAQQNAQLVKQQRQNLLSAQQAKGICQQLQSDTPAQALTHYETSFASQVAATEALQQVLQAAQIEFSHDAQQRLQQEHASFSAYQQDVAAAKQASAALNSNGQDLLRIEAHLEKVAPLASKESAAARRRGIRNMFFGVSYLVGFVTLVTFIELLLALY